MERDDRRVENADVTHLFMNRMADDARGPGGGPDGVGARLSAAVGACRRAHDRGLLLCFANPSSEPGRAGDIGWAGAALWSGGRTVAAALHQGVAGAAFEPGLLAPREGPLLEAALRKLPQEPDLVMVNATGRDHPRRAGLALHLGAVLDRRWV